MSQEKIVSIEERIPKLKQARKKKSNRRLVFYLSIFFILISVIIYLQSPLSHVREVVVNGNSLLEEEEVIRQSGLDDSTNIWTIDKPGITSALTSNPMVESAEISRKFPWTVKISLQEYKRIGYIKEESSYFPVLGNGRVLTQLENVPFKGDAPLLFNFTEEEHLHRMTAELDQLPHSLLNLISEIHWQPNESSKNNILLYMNDGYVVSGSIRSFAEKMQVYPSIVSQLDPDSEGIIHIGVGAYFEELGTGEAEEGQEGSEE
ncbi:cell division protein FtsQ/DivIB [Virgibacillus xinjiangensis]|uniref:Cell division protein DivIB n=1 Tax=Virgibacillus xinjiangensis TaxID=393090 RepID=A0ABV7CV70_9BACI